MLLAGIVIGWLLPKTAEALKPFNMPLVAVLIFFPTLKIDLRQNLESLRSDWRLTLISLAVIFLAMPALAAGLGMLTPLDPVVYAGLVINAAAPSMLTAPYNTERIGGRAGISWMLTVITTLLSPLVLLLSGMLVLASLPQLNLGRMVLDIFIVMVAPVSLALLVRRFLPRIIPTLLSLEHIFTLGIIVLVNWSVIGLNKSIIQQLSTFAFVLLLALGLFMDFGVFFITRALTRRRLGEGISRALAVSYGMKNAAMFGGVLVFYDPRLAIATSIFSLAHAFMFIMINTLKEKL